jgi:hypothetical protein
MGRMHSGGKGISKSSLPYKRAPPSWLKTTPEQVEEQVNKLAKRGLTPSQVDSAEQEIRAKFVYHSSVYRCRSVLFSATPTVLLR